MFRHLLLSLFILCVVDVGSARACSCAPIGPACSAFWRSDAVFAGRVIEIRPATGKATLTVRFAVQQRGRGVDGDIVDVEAEPQNGFNCGFSFTVGQQYVVYASLQTTGQLMTGMCSRTRPLASAAEDLTFFSEVQGPARGVRIFGQVRLIEDDLVSGHPTDRGAVDGARVGVKGANATREIRTAVDGSFDFRELPAGTYSVSVTPPPGLAFLGPPLPRRQHQRSSVAVTLTFPSECAATGWGAHTDAQITGILRLANGRPADDEAVELIAAENAGRAGGSIPHLTVRTGVDGRFTFAFVPRGTYVVGLNLGNPPPPTDLDRRSYYPGVLDAAAATRIAIEPGSRVGLEPLTIPEWPRERRISGTVVFSDGTPAPNATLTVTGAGPQSVPVDGEGRFTVLLPYGADFYLHAGSGRMVDDKWVGAQSRYQRIGRNDKDTAIVVGLIP
jgi:hypothetical protein